MGDPGLVPYDRPVRIVVVADTHIPDHAVALPPALGRALRRADLILHAGDVTSASLLEELEQFAPVRAALGNNDRASARRWGARKMQTFEVEGLRIGLLHDAGPRIGREARMRRRFPDAAMVVFGHSHIPIDVATNGLRLFNPGSPTWKRRQATPTYGVLDIVDRSARGRIVPLPD